MELSSNSIGAFLSSHVGTDEGRILEFLPLFLTALDMAFSPLDKAKSLNGLQESSHVLCKDKAINNKYERWSPRSEDLKAMHIE